MNTKHWTLYFPHNLRNELPNIDPTAQGSELTLEVRYDNDCIEILYNNTPIRGFKNIKKQDLAPTNVRQTISSTEMRIDFNDQDIENFHEIISDFFYEEDESNENTKEMKTIKKVFIANVSENDPFATELHDYLTRQGVSCFQYSIDLRPGQDIKQETKKEIEKSDHCILCFSKELNERKKTDMRREIYSAIAEAYERKPDSNFLIPVKVNQCEIENYSIDMMTSMHSLWYADFHDNRSKAYQDLLEIILGSVPEDSAKITEESTGQKLISLHQDNRTFLKFEGIFIGECLDYHKWNYKIYKTADTVKTCDYIIYVNRNNTNVHIAKLYEVLKFDSLASIKTDIPKKIDDEECTMKILEILGIEDSQYLE